MIELSPAFHAPTQQQVYRALLEAHSFPGRAAALPDELVGPSALLCVLATLVDHSTTLADAEGLISKDDMLRLEAQPATTDNADFVLFQADLAPPRDFAPRLGDVYQPHLGATVVLLVESLVSGDGVYELSGPGIDGKTTLELAGCRCEWFERRDSWVANYPMGVDIVLCDRRRVSALPRTTRMRWVGEGGR